VVPVAVRASDHASTPQAVLPVLVVGAIEGPLAPAIFPQSMRPLADPERLVGVLGSPDALLTSTLFPGHQVVTVSLDVADPLPGPAIAWTGLDALLLDEPAAARVTEAQLATLLAGGTAVAIRTEARPGGAWPWTPQGAWWVVRPDRAAHVELIQPERYALASADDAGAPAAFRRTVVLALVAFTLAAMLASLWRSRRAWVGVVVLAVLASIGLAVWRSRQPTSSRPSPRPAPAPGSTATRATSPSPMASSATRSASATTRRGPCSSTAATRVASMNCA
jgi:hypothetical protein